MHKQADFKLVPELSSHFKDTLEPPQHWQQHRRSKSQNNEGRKGQNASERASPVQSELRSTIGNGEMERVAELKESTVRLPQLNFASDLNVGLASSLPCH